MNTNDNSLRQQIIACDYTKFQLAKQDSSTLKMSKRMKQFKDRLENVFENIWLSEELQYFSLEGLVKEAREYHKAIYPDQPIIEGILISECEEYLDNYWDEIEERELEEELEYDE